MTEFPVRLSDFGVLKIKFHVHYKILLALPRRRKSPVRCQNAGKTVKNKNLGLQQEFTSGPALHPAHVQSIRPRVSNTSHFFWAVHLLFACSGSFSSTQFILIRTLSQDAQNFSDNRRSSPPLYNNTVLQPSTFDCRVIILEQAIWERCTDGIRTDQVLRA